MPELAEVEIIVRGLRLQITGQVIVAVPWLKPHLLANTPEKTFKEQIIGSTITDVQRRGKYILIALSNEQHLIVHLRMTGKLLVSPKNTEPNKHVHLIIELTDKALIFDDIRKFGRVWLIKNPDTLPALQKLGPDALSITIKELQNACDSKKPIKNLLLAQEKIAGLGNIYACEILYLAKIHPQTIANTLTARQIKKIHANIKPVLQKSIKAGGTSISDYVNSNNVPGSFQKLLNVYQKSDQPCPICQTPIIRIKIANRSTFLCPKCQVKE